MSRYVTPIDRAIGFFWPRRAVDRAAARVKLEALSSFGSSSGAGYSGARDSRQLRGWRRGQRSANTALLPVLEKLRGSSGDLIRNNALARGAIGTTVSSVIGQGLQLRSTIDRELLGLDPEVAEAWQDRAERLWRLWCKEGDFTRTLHFCDAEDLVLRSALERGDLLIARRFSQRRRRGELFRTKIHLIEGDRISTPYGREGDRNLYEGVEVDAQGVPVRWWVRKHHPDERYRHPDADQWTSVPAFSRIDGSRMALHVFKRTRIDQMRGEPWLAPVIEKLKQIDRYTEAELAAAVVSAAFAVFVKTEAAMGLADEVSDPNAPDDGTADSEIRDLPLGEGAIIDLAPGEEIETAKSERPNTNFDPFFEAIARQVGVALDMPFEVLVKHFASSYSASRASLLMAWEAFRNRRAFQVRNVNAPIYEWVISEAVATGLLEAPGFFESREIREAYLGARWRGPAMRQIQPAAEMGAVERRLALGLTTFSDEAAELDGSDWRETLRRRDREAELIEASGAPPPAFTGSPQPVEAGPDQVDTDPNLEVA